MTGRRNTTYSGTLFGDPANGGVPASVGRTISMVRHFLGTPAKLGPPPRSSNPRDADGAGSGNRTRVASLENWCTTTVLYPQKWWAGQDSNLGSAHARVVYSHVPLAAQVPALSRSL